MNSWDTNTLPVQSFKSSTNELTLELLPPPLGDDRPLGEVVAATVVVVVVGIPSMCSFV